MSNVITPDIATTLVRAGFIVSPLATREAPVIMCATVQGDAYAAPDWASLAHYAQHYALCECGNH